jgi:hypothetical protein
MCTGRQDMRNKSMNVKCSVDIVRCARVDAASTNQPSNTTDLPLWFLFIGLYKELTFLQNALTT